MILMLILYKSLSTFASFDGLDIQKLKSIPIASYSRPCCNFSVSVFTDLFNVSKLTSIDELGVHEFAGGKKNISLLSKTLKHSEEENGITYTCKTGFIDIAHIRDVADWTAHILLILPEMLGKGVSFPIRQEGGSTKLVFFPEFSKDEISKLTHSDFIEIAKRLAYEISVVHEIMTGLDVHVSTQFAKETSSAFSPEDNYSNLLGANLGAQAVESNVNYDAAMTALIQEKLIEMKALSKSEVEKAYNTIKNTWWKKALIPTKHSVMKKNMDAFGVVRAIPVENAEWFGCLRNEEMIHLTPPMKSKYFQFNVFPNKESKKIISSILKRDAFKVTIEDFDSLIIGVEKLFSEYLPVGFML